MIGSRSRPSARSAANSSMAAASLRSISQRAFRSFASASSRAAALAATSAASLRSFARRLTVFSASSSRFMRFSSSMKMGSFRCLSQWLGSGTGAGSDVSSAMNSSTYLCASTS